MIKLLDILNESIQDNPAELFNSITKEGNKFNLVPAKGLFFGNPGTVFTTKNNNASPKLMKIINDWIIANFPNNKLRVNFEKTFRTLNFYVKK